MKKLLNKIKFYFHVACVKSMKKEKKYEKI